ncbi:MAG TPA: YdeI/OmpD-associated family protein [Gemmatimonadaceae bacterium]|nr:YdeI/OmpD-associated family protein [Gemmatimonadaceae bacterium]
MTPEKPKTTNRDRAKGTDALVRAFKDAKAWEWWLVKNQTATDGLWMRIAKKASGTKSITYPEAVEVALCYGWIDAQKKPESETTWLQRFVPRRPRSIWSKINREKALGLIAIGRMQPAGLQEVDRAKKDGRWESAYDSPKNAPIHPDFQKALDESPRASEFFKTLNAANRYAILWRLHTAKKAETRAKRMRSFIEMLEKGETLH